MVEDNDDAFYATDKHMIPINTLDDRMEIVSVVNYLDKNRVEDDDNYIGNINNNSKIRISTSVSIINDINKQSVICMSLINTLVSDRMFTPTTVMLLPPSNYNENLKQTKDFFNLALIKMNIEKIRLTPN